MSAKKTQHKHSHLFLIQEPPVRSIGIKKSREKTRKSREKIVALLAQDGKLSAAALAKQIGLSAKTIEKHLAKLKADGTIERIGPAKGGYWKVKQHSLTLS